MLITVPTVNPEMGRIVSVILLWIGEQYWSSLFPVNEDERNDDRERCEQPQCCVTQSRPAPYDVHDQKRNYEQLEVCSDVPRLEHALEHNKGHAFE